MDTFELLRDFIQRRVTNPPAEIALDSPLDDIGIDSLSLLSLMFDMEDTLGVRMPDDLPKPQTVGDLIAIFDSLKNQPPNA
jgi:acyl carrier protein